MDSVPPGWVFIETDASRFDGHQHVRWFDLLKLLWKRTVFKGTPRKLVLKSLRAQAFSKSQLPDGSHCRIEGTMKSGCMFTTLLNSIVNMLLLDLAAKRVGVRCRIMVSGDDGVLAVHPSDVARLSEAVRQVTAGLGHSYKVKIADRSEVTFLSSHFVPAVCHKDGLFLSGWVLVPRLGKFLTKFGWATELQPQPEKWFRENMYAASVLYRATPAISRLFELPGAVASVVELPEERNPLRKRVECEIDARIDAEFDFSRAFGVSDFELGLCQPLREGLIEDETLEAVILKDC